MNRFPFLSRLLFLSLLASLSVAGLAAPPEVQSVQAVYKVYLKGLPVGHDEERFERTGERYRITSETRAEGLAALFVRAPFTLVSEGRIVGDELQPLSYRSSRGDPARAVSARFDWDRKLMEATRGDKQESFELPAGTQDRLSAMYQFMLKPPTSESVTARMTQGKKPESYHYVKQGEETLHTAAGDFATVYYAREAKEGESKVQLWLAKDHNFLPVRIVFEDKNGKFEQQLVELKIQ